MSDIKKKNKLRSILGLASLFLSFVSGMTIIVCWVHLSANSYDDGIYHDGWSQWGQALGNLHYEILMRFSIFFLILFGLIGIVCLISSSFDRESSDSMET